MFLRNVSNVTPQKPTGHKTTKKNHLPAINVFAGSRRSAGKQITHAVLVSRRLNNTHNSNSNGNSFPTKTVSTARTHHERQNPTNCTTYNNRRLVSWWPSRRKCLWCVPWAPPERPPACTQLNGHADDPLGHGVQAFLYPAFAVFISPVADSGRPRPLQTPAEALCHLRVLPGHVRTTCHYASSSCVSLTAARGLSDRQYVLWRLPAQWTMSPRDNLNCRKTNRHR